MKRIEAVRMRRIIEQAVQSLPDNVALAAPMLYPTFESIIGKTVSQNFRFTYGGRLWSVVQTEMTVQAHYPPGVGMESLYAEVCEIHAGTLEDPIP